ncbi:PKD-like family lipoprotein [Marinifilum sp.]|uniref:PKD-like family lipoprotein n=1 Tax=Marinifilum sp. TaxID=2033137 RepID=UPI003BAA1A01
MERIIYILLIMVIAWSCIEDDGNYEYKDPQEVDFSSMPSEMDLILGEDLFIAGDIETDADMADLDFAWYVEGNDEFGHPTFDTLSIDKDLDVIVNIPPGNGIRLFYSVYNNKLDVHYEKAISVNVVTPFSTGWGYITDKGGNTEYSFISEITGKTYLNALEAIGGEVLSGKPVRLSYNSDKYEEYNHVVILTETGGAVYDGYSGRKIEDLLDRWRSTDKVEFPFIDGAFEYGASHSLALFFAGGKIFPKEGFHFHQGFWEVPATGDYEATGPVAHYYEKMIFFDAKYKRYMYINPEDNPWEVEELSVTNPETKPFDPENLNKTCLWMRTNVVNGNHAGSNTTMAVLKDDAGKFYVQEFVNDNSDGFIPLAEVELPGDLDDNSCFDTNPVFPYTYVSAGNVIHRYNRTTKGIQTDYITVEDNITDMYVHNDGNMLGVVVDNGAGSKVLILDLDNNGAVLESYESEDKIVDLKYKRME